MKITVRAKLKSKQNLVKKLDDTTFEVYIKQAPIEGKANQAIIKSLAEYFHTAPSNITIIQGLTSKQKIIEIQMAA